MAVSANRGPFFGSPCNKGHSIFGSALGPPISGNPPFVTVTVGHCRGRKKRVHPKAGPGIVPFPKAPQADIASSLCLRLLPKAP